VTTTDSTLCWIYGVIAAVALVATWWNNIDFVTTGANGGLTGFIDDAWSNPAAASLAWDVVFVGIAAQIFMYVEGRRVGVPYLWLYIVAGAAVAISVAFPLFLIARQVRLAPVASGRG
jgi:hypothetical protein